MIADAELADSIAGRARRPAGDDATVYAPPGSAVSVHQVRHPTRREL